MMKKLALQWFIEQNKDWESILSSKPYCLNISRENIFGKNLILFKYDAIETEWDKCGRVAWEARGIVLDEDTLEVVNYGFDKFFNSHEPYADEIDSNSMISSTKIDGSIIKIRKFSDDNLLISTNGCINAYHTEIQSQVGSPYKYFGEIVEKVLVDKFGSIEVFKHYLDTDKTYIFELVSPWTRVCTPYPEDDMYLIGCRTLSPENNFMEIPFWKCSLKEYFPIPEILNFSSIDKCLEYAKTLDWTNEGYVIVDKYFKRVKCKNPEWLTVHHLVDNHTLSYKRAIELIRSNEKEEVLSYFPEFKERIHDIEVQYNNYIADIAKFENEINEYIKANGYDKQHWLIENGGADRKVIASWIMSTNKSLSGFAFGYIDGKFKSAKEYVDAFSISKLVIALGYKD